MANSRLTVLIEGKNNLSPTVKQAEKSVSEFTNKSKHLDDVKKKFDKIEDSGMNVAKKLSETKKAMRELALAGETNTKAFEQMRKAAQSYKKTLDDVDKSIKNAGKNPFEKIAGNVGDITSKMGLGNIGSSVASAITNPYILAGTAVVGATKALWDYEVELDRSLQKTAQFTGLAGDELMSLRNGIKAVADTFGSDYDSILSTVDGMMRQFGINGEEALQIINNGFQSMGEGGAQKVLDMISKYQGAFNDAGISASELVAIIGNTRSGIFSDEGMDLIATSAKKIREFGKQTQEALIGVGIDADAMFNKIQSGQMTTVQAMQEISTKLKGLSPQSKEVGDVLKNVFGKQGAAAGYELVTALADVETNLDIVKQQTGDWGDAMNQLQQANREFENAMSSLFGVADGGFSTMTTKLKAEVFGAVAKVINGFIDWYNKSIIVRGAVANIALSFKNAWEIIKAILKIFMNSIQGLSEMIQGVFELDWGKVKAGWKNGISNILKNIADGFANIKENVAEAAEQTLHGQIKKLDIPVEVEYSANKGKISGKGVTTGGKSSSISNNGSSKSSNINNSGDKLPDVPKFESGSLAELKKQYQEWQQMRENTNWAIKSEIEYDNFLQQGKELEEKIKELEEKLGIRISIETTNNGNDLDTVTDDLNNTKNVIDDISNSIGSMGSAFGSLGSAIGGTSGDMINFAGQSIQAISQMIPQIISLISASEAEAIATGTAAGAGLPFPANLAAIASIIATITGVFASLPKFAEGGIVGGASKIGDHLLARVNSGEMILNGKQQDNLFKAIDNNRLSSGFGGQVDFKIDGRVIKGVLKNVNDKISKQS